MEVPKIENAEDEQRAQQLVDQGCAVDIATARLIVVQTRRLEEQQAHGRSSGERTDDVGCGQG